MTVTAKRFGLRGSVFPGSLYLILAKEMQHVKQDDFYLSIYLNKYSENWSLIKDLDSAAVIIQMSATAGYAITAKVRVNEVWHSSTWVYKGFGELDTYIMSAIIRCVTDRLTHLPGKVDVIETLYLTEKLEEESGIIFSNTTQFAGNSITLTIRIFVNGTEIAIQENNEFVKNIVIPWNQILEWLQS